MGRGLPPVGRAALAWAIGAIIVATAAGPAFGAATGADAAAASPPAHERAASPAPWAWPVARPVVVTAPYRAPATPYAAGHRGIDVRTAVGAEVVAPAPGTVAFVGPVAGRGVLTIDHGDGVVSSFEPVESTHVAGTPVGVGEPIAIVAAGGHCASGCLHLGVRVDGEYVSPFLFLGGIPRAVLLPWTG